MESYRIGAIHKVHEDKTIEFFGYGTFLGEEVPPPEITFLGMPILDDMPKLLLDSGEIVWGCECHWASERQIQVELKDKNVIMADIVTVRSNTPQQEKHDEDPDA